MKKVCFFLSGFFAAAVLGGLIWVVMALGSVGAGGVGIEPLPHQIIVLNEREDSASIVIEHPRQAVLLGSGGRRIEPVKNIRNDTVALAPGASLRIDGIYGYRLDDPPRRVDAQLYGTTLSVSVINDNQPTFEPSSSNETIGTIEIRSHYWVLRIQHDEEGRLTTSVQGLSLSQFEKLSKSMSLEFPYVNPIGGFDE